MKPKVITIEIHCVRLEDATPRLREKILAIYPSNMPDQTLYDMNGIMVLIPPKYFLRENVTLCIDCKNDQLDHDILHEKGYEGYEMVEWNLLPASGRNKCEACGAEHTEFFDVCMEKINEDLGI